MNTELADHIRTLTLEQADAELDRDLWFSPSANLLCTRRGNEFYILNGDWFGIKKGDFLQIQYDEKREIKITDWENYSREEFNEKYPNFGY